MVAVKWVGSRHFTPQTGIRKRHIDMHWMVGNLRGTDVAFNGSRSASAHYGIENGVVHQYVNEKDYSYANGNTYANRYGVTIEHAGGWLLPDGSRMKPSAETHETSAHLCAEISRRWGLGNLVVGENLFPHNHWVATACPGTLDLAWIATRANQILNPKKAGPRHMYRAALKDTKRVAYFDSITFRETTDGSVDDNAWGRFVGKPGLVVSQAEWDAYERVARENAAMIPAGSGGSLSPAEVEVIAKRFAAMIPKTITGSLGS